MELYGVMRAIASAHSRRLRSDKGVCLRMTDRAPVAGICMKTRKKTVMSSRLIRVEQEMFPRYILKNNTYKMIAIILIPIDPVGPHCYRGGTKPC